MTPAAAVLTFIAMVAFAAFVALLTVLAISGNIEGEQ